MGEKGAVMLVEVDQLSVVRQRVGALPLVNRVLDRLRLAEVVARYLPCDDARLKVSPAQVVGVVVRNLLLAREPAYGIGAWSAGFDPALLGLAPAQVGFLTDDRIASVLDGLFDADRASLFTELIAGMVNEFDLDTSEVHNDSTTVTLKGARPDRGGRTRGGKAVPALKHGHNKDFRPDLPQLLFILTTSADGSVPLLHRVADGNLSDDQTHIQTWDSLRKLLGRNDFLYVADSKLCTRGQMDHIDAQGGRFVTVLPRSRSEDGYFRRDWLPAHLAEVRWEEVRRREGPRKDDPDDVWWAFEFPHATSEGHRIIWIRFNRRIDTDAEDRTRRIHKALTGLDELNQRLAAPKARTRDLVSAWQAASTVVEAAGAGAWLTYHAEPIKDYPHGRPAYRGKDQPRQARPHFVIKVKTNHDAVTHAALSDGCYPLITNDPDLTPAEVLHATKHQPHLERRFHTLKTDHAVMPLHLQRPERIEALLSCHFIALLVGALIEREIRQAMAEHNLPHLNLYHEDRPCTAPSSARVLAQFDQLARHNLVNHTGKAIHTYQPVLDPIHQQILNLLTMTPHDYTRSPAQPQTVPDLPPHGAPPQ